MPDSDDGEIEPGRRDEIEDENDNGPLPVSYTHLTLPTKA